MHLTTSAATFCLATLVLLSATAEGASKGDLDGTPKASPIPLYRFKYKQVRSTVTYEENVKALGRFRSNDEVARVDKDYTKKGYTMSNTQTNHRILVKHFHRVYSSVVHSLALAMSTDFSVVTMNNVFTRDIKHCADIALAEPAKAKNLQSSSIIYPEWCLGYFSGIVIMDTEQIFLSRAREIIVREASIIIEKLNIVLDFMMKNIRMWGLKFTSRRHPWIRGEITSLLKGGLKDSREELVKLLSSAKKAISKAPEGQFSPKDLDILRPKMMITARRFINNPPPLPEAQQELDQNSLQVPEPAHFHQHVPGATYHYHYHHPKQQQ
ncbi:hypothetical protein BJ684DRAFT_20668 [Piptocephalis cylindrospora]|uniref:Uncharacterized protein n=1 Tax=Piptocephalis cylindrospora TaxID=1907219 RepID=A0A4P9Y4R2_9FUNG|nr:hypothetical protein BJ684DRAFT_20668 [Piptocephalis cylindrospora]|eukprot:RKP12810.1 hypothetical protein BJ684DRAFT_20668 [Piptocephalis cylindrospora]